MVEIESVVDRDVPALEGSSSRLRHLAWPLGALGLLLPATAATLLFLNRSAIHPLHGPNPAETIAPIGYAIIGALLASRRPRNPIGWIFLGIAICVGLNGVATEYVFRSSHFHHLPLVRWVAWSHDWVAWVSFPSGLVGFFFLLFPDGRLQSRRWRRLAWIAAASAVVGVAIYMVEPTIQLAGSQAMRNPLGLAGMDTQNGAAGLIWLVGFVVLITAMVGTIMRTRRSTGELRQQLRWLGYATIATGAGLVAVAVASSIDPKISDVWWDLVLVLGLGVAVP